MGLHTDRVHVAETYAATELTKAAIEKMSLNQATGNNNDAAAQQIADNVAAIYKTISAAVVTS